MKTVSLETVSNGFEFELPPASYWFKAGAAFTLGAGVIYVVAVLAWLLLLSIAPGVYLLRAFRVI